MASGVIIVGSTAAWDTILEKAGSKPIIVDFYADWCGPCKAIAPQFAKLAADYGSKAIFLKVNVDDCSEIAERAGISAMPTFQVWVEGKQQDSVVGANIQKLTEVVIKYTS